MLKKKEFVKNDFRNPDWYLYKIIFLFKKNYSCFSITFETSGKSETGRFFWSVFEHFMCNGLSLAMLQS